MVHFVHRGPELTSEPPSARSSVMTEGSLLCYCHHYSGIRFITTRSKSCLPVDETLRRDYCDRKTVLGTIKYSCGVGKAEEIRLF